MRISGRERYEKFVFTAEYIEQKHDENLFLPTSRVDRRLRKYYDYDDFDNIMHKSYYGTAKCVIIHFGANTG